MKKYLFASLAALALIAALAGCGPRFGESGFMSREEYLSARHDWAFYEDCFPESFSRRMSLHLYGEMQSMDEIVDNSLKDGVSPREGQLYLVDDRTATIFLDENVTFYAYFKEWILCVIDGRKFIAIDTSGKNRQHLFTFESDILGYTDEIGGAYFLPYKYDFGAVYFLSEETIWRYIPGEKTPEKVITFPGMVTFGLVSNVELVWFAPSQEYTDFIAALKEQGITDSYERDIALTRAGLAGTGGYFMDVRDGIIYQSEPFDMFAKLDSDPRWYEQYRHD